MYEFTSLNQFGDLHHDALPLIPPRHHTADKAYQRGDISDGLFTKTRGVTGHTYALLDRILNTMPLEYQTSMPKSRQSSVKGVIDGPAVGAYYGFCVGRGLVQEKTLPARGYCIGSV